MMSSILLLCNAVTNDCLQHAAKPHGEYDSSNNKNGSDSLLVHEAKMMMMMMMNAKMTLFWDGVVIGDDRRNIVSGDLPASFVY